MKKSVKTALTRITSVLLLGALCATAVLYQRGVFDFSFYNRDKFKGDSQTSAGETTFVPVDTTAPGGDTVRPDSYALQFTDALKAATNISNVGAGILKGGEAVHFEYPVLSEMLANGYSISYGDYDLDENMVLCRLDADIPTEYNEKGYGCSIIHFYAEATNNFTVPKGKRTVGYATHKGVHLYMGYIITDNGKEQNIYTSTGEKLYTGHTDALTPALTRDLNGNPLFYSTDDEFENYYYIDENKELKISDYNDQTDNRGLYFDYVPTYGLADNDIVKYHSMVTVVTEITSQITQTEPPIPETEEPAVTDAVTDTSEVTDEVTVFVEDTTEAPPEETLPPDTEADTTEEATEEATEDTTEETEESYDTEGENGDEEYYEGEEGYEPVDETLPSEEPEITEPEITEPEVTEPEVTEPEETEPEVTEPEVTEPETEFNYEDHMEVTEDFEDTTEETTEEIPEDTTTAETADTVADESTDITEEVTADTTTEDTTPEDTTEAPPQYVVIETLYSQALRFAYGYNEWYHTTNYTFKEAYNYSEGLAAVVYPDNVMLFLTEWGSNHYPLYREGNYWNENGRLAFSIYTAPLVRDISDIGSLYFDRGYVRVRQLDTDAVYGNPDYLIGQYELILDQNGNIFRLPSDYELVGYSDGVLLVERDGLYGYYSTEGRWIAQPIYTFARPFAEGLGVIGFENGIKGVIDTAGNVVIPFDYKEISQVSTGIIAAYGEKNGWEFFAKITK